MPLLRIVKCDVCGEQLIDEDGSGFKDWMKIDGIVLDGNDDVWLCKTHRDKVANFIDEMKHGKIKLVE